MVQLQVILVGPWIIQRKCSYVDHEDDLLRRLFKEIEEYLRDKAEQYLKEVNLWKDRAQIFKQNQWG